MKVTVIIPLYNKAPYIKRALDSVIAQTWTEYEVLVVDDGSTDGGGEIVSQYGDPRIRLITQANAGPGAARNRGLAEAKGEYVAFLDADDEWLPGFLGKCLTVLERSDKRVASVTSGYLLYPQGHSTEAMWRKRGLREGNYEIDAATSPQFLIYLLAYLTPCNTVARRDVLRQWGGFFSQNRCVYGEDSYLWLKVLLNETVAVTLEALVSVHSEASALSGNLHGPRPIEPMLTHPSGIEESCPASLCELLKQVLALRAMKTACVLSYWGQWRVGRQLLRQFCIDPVYNRSFFWLAQLCATPIGALSGKVLRFIRNSAKALTQH